MTNQYMVITDWGFEVMCETCDIANRTCNKEEGDKVLTVPSSFVDDLIDAMDDKRVDGDLNSAGAWAKWTRKRLAKMIDDKTMENV